MNTENKSRAGLTLFVILTIAATLLAAILSIFLGSTNISFDTVLQALFHPDMNSQQQIAILELRLPRTIGDLLTGACLAAAGAMMQGVTRNPLADAGLLGINAGASFALALCMAFFSSLGFGFSLFCTFLGASGAVAIVYGLLRLNHRRSDPIRMVLAGSAVSIFLTSLSQGLAIYFNIGQDMTFWTAGGTASIRMNQLQIAAPVMIIALLMGWTLSRKIAVLSLGDETAQSLGIHVEKTQALCLFVVMLLAGAATALAGPIAFVGLLVPYFVRFFVGSDYRRVIPCSMIAGALFMVSADLLSRLVNQPSETPVGLIFALIGVPVFIWICRRGGEDVV